MNLYLDGFHFYADDMGRQVEAHPYCTHLNEDVHQCVIYDSNGDHARLIGIEYIVGERLFEQLPEEEKPLWRSLTTYGKTWHTWQVDRGDQLPLGIPQLMRGFTRDGQIDQARRADRDARLEVSSADSWESGEVRNRR